jgi:dienelactone hydrolase
VVSFHGALQTKMPAQPGKVRAKILVCTGADDPFVPLDQVNAFVNEMREAGTDYQVIIYGNTKHAFTNPKASELGLQQRAYNQSSDERSWAAMESFFHEIFGTKSSHITL